MNVRHFGSSYAYPAGGTCPEENHNAGKCTNPAATLFGLNALYSSSKDWSYSLSVNNLLDRRPVDYRYYTGGYNIAVDDVYGRYFTVTATYRF